MRTPAALSLAALSLALMAQDKTPTFSTTTNLVIVDVAVTDRDGKPIDGLTAKDFRIFEDGKPQTISVFEFQRLSTAPLPAVKPEPEQRRVLTKEQPAEAQPAPAPSPAQIRYRDRRLIVLFFDFTSMPVADQSRARDAALKFLDTQMTSSDMVSIMTYTSELKTLQDFTDDRESLEQIIKSFRIGEMSDLAALAATGDDTTDETNTVFTADETEFNIFNTDQKLSALENAVGKLRAMPEKKALVYFSSGISQTGVENQSQLRSTVNAAVRANVAFYPIDVRGLTALPPGGAADQAASRGTGIFSGAAQASQRSSFNATQDTLDTLASDTGGKALLDSNDLTLGIRQAQNDIRDYYVLGYYSTNPAMDGRYRRIEVRLVDNPRAKLDYRSGYYGPKEYAKFNSNDKERQLEDALSAGDPVTDLPLALEADFFRMPGNQYFVPVALRLPGSEISLTKKGANGLAEFDFIGQVTDARKRPAGTVRDTIRVKLNETETGQIERRSLEYDTGFTLSPGNYVIKFLARDNQTGKMGTFETKFTVPNLNAETKSLRVSSVVMGSQLEPVSAAVGQANRRDKLAAMHPLVSNGKKLIPSVTHVFRKDQNLYVYFEVYDAAPAQPQGSPSVAATLSFFRGKTKVYESAPIRVSQVLPRRQGAVPFQFQAPLEKLAPGRYTCQVNVVDELGRKFAFPREPLVMLP
jgi:VWFA-related protein